MEEKKMKDVTPDEPMEMAEMPKKWYPCFTLKIEDIPEANNWDIGSNYLLVVGVKMKSLHKDEREETVTFDVVKVKPIKK